MLWGQPRLSWVAIPRVQNDAQSHVQAVPESKPRGHPARDCQEPRTTFNRYRRWDGCVVEPQRSLVINRMCSTSPSC